ncbi:MAG: GAF domain-containing protein, partial [Burkholderiales bacterium]|nr:GAF domain-containing protein [Opitutaceae bacterium]
MNAPVPPDESERLETLRRYAVLDTPPEAAFDEIAALAARLCEAPYAAVTLVDAGRQWFKAVVGVAARETPREEGICAHVVLAGAPMQVADASIDSRFAHLPFVLGEPHVRFYAGVPLRAPSGQVLGTLCVFDRRPRTLSAEQMDTLGVLAAQVMAQLELRRHLHEQARTESALLGILEDQRSAEEALRRSEREQRALAERLEAERASLAEAQAVARMGGWETDLATFAVRWSEQTHRIFETDLASVAPTHELFLAFVHPEDRVAVDEAFRDSLGGGGE